MADGLPIFLPRQRFVTSTPPVATKRTGVSSPRRLCRRVHFPPVRARDNLRQSGPSGQLVSYTVERRAGEDNSERVGTWLCSYESCLP